MGRNNEQKQYIVVGLGRFGRAIAETLCEDGAEVLGVDSRMDLVERMRDELTQTIQMSRYRHSWQWRNGGCSALC